MPKKSLGAERIREAPKDRNPEAEGRERRSDKKEDKGKERKEGLLRASRAGIPVAKLPPNVNRDAAASSGKKITEQDVKAALHNIESYKPEEPADRGARGDGRNYGDPWKRHPNQGAFTGNPRPAYPKVFRPFGPNTRQRVVGDRSSVTRMHHLGYAKGIVESVPVPPLLSSSASLGQSGAQAVNRHVSALHKGSRHLLFTSG